MRKAITLICMFMLSCSVSAQIKLPQKENEQKAPAKQAPAKTAEVKPVFTQPVFTLKVIPDADCRFYVDGEFQATIQKDEIAKISLNKGEYKLKAVSLNNEADVFKELYTVNPQDIGTEKFYEIAVHDILKITNQQQKVAEEKAIMESYTYNFTDDFTDKRNSWFEADDKEKIIIKIEDGKLIIDVIEDGNYFTIKTFPIASSKDFSVEVKKKWITGINNNGYGIDFASDYSAGNFYSFIISSNGYYRIHHVKKGGKWTNLIDWTKTDGINQGSVPNILKIQKSGNEIIFFVNDDLVKKMSWDDGYGTSFGFRVFGAQTIQFDDFRISGMAK